MSRARAAIAIGRNRDGRPTIVDDVRAIVARHADIVAEFAVDAPHDPAIPFDRLVSVGGDGTLIAQCRRLAGTGVPVVGVNNGRLGFLAEFDLHSLDLHAASIFGASPLVRHRMLLEVRVVARDGTLSASHVAMNDAVVTAGPPYHMIELRLGLNGEDGPVIDGDGCIVSTPVGSTAYNASAGGPVVHPDTEVLIVTPEAAHSLAFRPVVVPSHTDVRLDVMRANPGTSLLCDGIPVESLKVGDTVVVSRHHHMARLIANPDCSYLHTLSQKLRWAAPPDYRG